jgi:hypothetical protein
MVMENAKAPVKEYKSPMLTESPVLNTPVSIAMPDTQRGTLIKLRLGGFSRKRIKATKGTITTLVTVRKAQCEGSVKTILRVCSKLPVRLQTPASRAYRNSLPFIRRRTFLKKIQQHIRKKSPLNITIVLDGIPRSNTIVTRGKDRPQLAVINSKSNLYFK